MPSPGADGIWGTEDDDLGDLHLQSDSPCIDAGTSDNAPVNDIVGTPRPQGAGFDMGAYEYLPTDTIRGLVDEYYFDILDREPDQGGWDYWASEIERIMALGINVGEGFQAEARLFFTCQEYLDKNKTKKEFVTDLYQTFLQREPDAGRSCVLDRAVKSGLTRNMLITAFAYCDEFKEYMTTQFGADTTRPENNMLNDLYRGFLNRFPDDGGFNSWLTQMRQAQCTGQAAVRDLSYQSRHCL